MKKNNHLLRHYCSNLVSLPGFYIAGISFNETPKPLHISGTRESAHGLFDHLEPIPTLAEAGIYFQNYMGLLFGRDQPHRSRDAGELRRYRNSYLRLIQDWGMDSNNAQGAVLKGWVESRFGIFPTYHKVKLNNFSDAAWMTYVEEKMNSRYHNNAIYMQLDLLYEFCQFALQKYLSPQPGYKTLYRGVESIDEDQIAFSYGNRDKVVYLNNLVSLTDRRSVASEFGGYILELNVPLQKLVFFSDLLPAHALRGESEYLAIGGHYRVTINH